MCLGVMHGQANATQALFFVNTARHSSSAHCHGAVIAPMLAPMAEAY
jgi:hypothetical protein